MNELDLAELRMQACVKRIARIREELTARDLDACYVRELSNIAWASAFDGVFDEEPAHALIITSDAVLLHSDSRYGAALEEAAQNTDISISLEPGGHAKFLLEHLPANARVAIEDTLTLREFHGLEDAIASADAAIDLVEQRGLIEELRATKDDLEIALMRRAQAITDAAFVHIITLIEPGMTEVHVQRALDAFMLDAGAEGLAFPTIVATGDHAASPHAIAGERPIAVGDAIVMDFGARFGGYCSDMTRTIFVGEPTPELKRAWEALRSANEKCEAALYAGKTGAEMHQLAESILAEHGFAGRMGHGLGHSLGLDIHEDPSLAPRNTDPLPAGATITVEPGIYIPGEFGMRLEDFGVVTDAGFEVITQSTHDMVIIDPR